MHYIQEIDTQTNFVKLNWNDVADKKKYWVAQAYQSDKYEMCEKDQWL